MTKTTAPKILTVTVIFALIAAMALSFAGCAKEQEKNEGSVTITVEIVDNEGTSTEYTISTDTGTLWEALEQEGLAQGDDSEYGIMIHTVNGLRADYTLDGEYLSTGAESTKISDGEHYELVYTKA